MGTLTKIGIVAVLSYIGLVGYANLCHESRKDSLEGKIAEAAEAPAPAEELSSHKYGINNPDVAKVVDNLVEIRTPRGAGTGFFINPTTIVTAYHVLADEQNHVSIPISVNYQGHSFEAGGRFVGSPGADMAKLELPEPVPKVHTLKKYNNPGLILYQSVQMVGFRLGEFTNTFGATRDARLEGCYAYVDTDLNVRKGNSGSPVIDSNTGSIVGVVVTAQFPAGSNQNTYAANGDATISFIGNLDRPCSQ